MSRRTHESPMDFEYSNGTGPIDGRSPFAHISQNAQRFPPSNTKKRACRADVDMLDAPVLMGRRAGTYSALDSPSKPATSHTPSPSKPLPAVPAFSSMFNTPRKLNNDYDDSSAGETPRSPEQNNDSDATPDYTNLRNNQLRGDLMSALPGADRSSSPSKEHNRPQAQRRESWLSTQLIKAKNKFSSPGRGEIARVDHNTGMEKRVEKRRKKDINRKESRRRRHSMSDSGDDGNNNQALSSPRKASRQYDQSQDISERKQHWLTTFYTFIESHPTVPHIMSWYAQLFFNVFLLSCFAYAIYSAWSAFASDVDKKAYEATADIMAEMAICAEHYVVNMCDRSTRLPAMGQMCDNWDRCMNRDPAKIGRAKVSAHTFAEIFNSFMEPISYKAMIFTFLLVFGCFGISNLALYVKHLTKTTIKNTADTLKSGLFRKTESVGAFPLQQYYQHQAPPPPTPQRHFSGQEGMFYGGTPWQNQPQGLEPQASGAYGQIDGRGSPVRRIQF
ncbi:hypothetical protein LTR62_004176 [Meristemomyces frigidus]|uniref:Brl1/Brr6 domain-containing protein n=1 Tax=Meristemomyces frigidus TaxID=1508187 RepID=A0AAN7TI46_9PEZI|nr:hypothetical protein LTR62_004176 [Meristemomyces frigidus]